MKGPLPPPNTHPYPPEGRENKLANSTGFQRALFQSSRKKEEWLGTSPNPSKGGENELVG